MNPQAASSQSSANRRATAPSPAWTWTRRLRMCGAWCLWLALGLPCPADEVSPLQRSFVGTASCANASCHGNADARSPLVWKASYWTWGRQDPHRRAFDVLFAPRSVVMLERLVAASTPPSSDSPEQTSALAQSPTKYLAALEERCLGCHATPAPPVIAPAESRDRPRDQTHDAGRFADGVSCESCHGAAGEWLAPHTSRSWNDLSPEVKQHRFGFAVTKNLTNRPAVCVGCHVGPQDREGRRFAVDHELIAAGHPRLEFEFSAALANLPPHWDVARDRIRHQATNSTTSFHFDAWQAGQIHVARAQYRGREPLGAEPAAQDLARYDCFACHRRLHAEPTESRASGDIAPLRIASLGLPQPTWGALASARALFKLSGPSAADLSPTSAAPWADSSLKRWIHSTDAIDALRLKEPTANQRGPLVLNELIETLNHPQARSWDNMLQLHLALRAWLADVDPRGASPLASAAHDFQGWLDGRFETPKPSRYDSPSRYRATDPELNRLLRRLQQELLATTAETAP